MKDLFDVQQLSQFEFGAIIITVLVAGLVFGCLLAYALLKRKNSPSVDAAVAIKEEFEEYKYKVDDHFNKTSEMFKDVTTQYKKLYDHMAVGAIELSNADTITMPRLEMQESEDTESSENDVVIDETPVEEPADTTTDALDDTSEDSSVNNPTNSAEPEEIVNQDTGEQIVVDDNAQQKETKTS